MERKSFGGDYANKIENADRNWIKNWEIGELEAPILKIIERLSDKIENGEYSAIIGEDASGRIPTLIFDRFLSSVYKEHKLPHPITIFVPGSRYLEKDKMEEKKEKIKARIVRIWGDITQQTQDTSEDKKALIVTDGIFTGDSLKPLTEVMSELQIPFDIATISLFKVNDNSERALTNEEVVEMEKKLNAPIYWALPYETDLFRSKEKFRKDINLVSKGSEDVVSSPNKNWDGYNDEQRKKIQEDGNEARQDVKIVSERIIEKYLSRPR